jgi:hypothetical protein
MKGRRLGSKGEINREIRRKRERISREKGEN